MAQDTKTLETYPFIVDHAYMTEQMRNFGWRSASSAEIPELIALGEALINDKLADADIVDAVHTRTGISAWAFGEDPIEGLVLNVPLTLKGLKNLQAGVFNPGAPKDEEIAAIGDQCAGCYIGIYAGATHAARKAVMTGAAVIRMGVFSQVPCFARAATEDGARSMESLGWSAAGFGIDKLWMQGALSAPEKKVA
ncbi:MAG: hypothetical protein AAFO74_15185 [Pseudomonadota bacterium]